MQERVGPSGKEEGHAGKVSGCEWKGLRGQKDQKVEGGSDILLRRGLCPSAPLFHQPGQPRPCLSPPCFQLCPLQPTPPTMH